MPIETLAVHRSPIMNKLFAASAVAAALGIASAPLTVTPAHADDKAKEKCYGVSKAGKNDCAAGTHSCAGTATQDFDKSSWLYVPKGLCEKLAGGSLEAGK
jgi:uncharacterized membrane protein